MSPRLKKWLVRLGYPAFYFMALLTFLYLTFPFDRLKDRLVAEFNSNLRSGDAQLHIDSLDSYWLSGVEAEGVRLSKPAPPATSANPKPKAQETRIDQLQVRTSLLPLLVGTIHVAFSAKALGGEVEGHTSDADGNRTLAVEVENLDVGQVSLVSEVVGLPMKGALSGKVDLVLPEGKLSKADGSIELTISNLSVGDGKAKLKDTLALPKLQAGNVELRAEATKGQLTIDKLNAKGKDLELVSSGRIRLRDSFDSSIMELNLRFRFADAYKEKNDTTKGLFGSKGSKAPALFDLDPKNRRAKRPDGFYAWRASGPVSRIQFNPAGGAAAVGGRGSPRPKLGGFPRQR